MDVQEPNLPDATLKTRSRPKAATPASHQGRVQAKGAQLPLDAPESARLGKAPRICAQRDAGRSPSDPPGWRAAGATVHRGAQTRLPLPRTCGGDRDWQARIHRPEALRYLGIDGHSLLLLASGGSGAR